MLSIQADGQSAGLAAENGAAQLKIDDLKRRLKAGGSEEKKLKEACQGFESMFIYQLLTQMRKTVPKGGYLHSPYEERYQSLFDQELADSFAKSGGIGLADQMFDNLKSRLKNSDPTNKLTGSTNVPNGSVLRSKLLGELNNENLNRGSFSRPLERISGESLAPASIFAEIQMDFERRARVPASPGSLSADPIEGQTNANLPPGLVYAPVDGRLTSLHGWRQDPINGTKSWHSGLDIAAPTGTPIGACLEGEVVFSGSGRGYGNHVIIDHGNGWHSLYGHNSKNLVKVGDKIKTGQEIAKVGSTGRSTGPHVHFELRLNGAAVDPKAIGQAQSAALGTAYRNKNS